MNDEVKTINDLLAERTKAERDYKESKLTLTYQKACDIVAEDWNSINKERETLGLPKITNEAQRRAYRDTKYYEADMDIKRKEVMYHDLEYLCKTIIGGMNDKPKQE